MAIKIQSRQVLPTGQTAGLSLSQGAFQQEFQGQRNIGAMTKELAIVIDQIDRAEGDSQFATARMMTNKEIDNLQIRLQDNSEPSTYQQELTKTIESFNSENFTPKNKRGAAQYRAWVQANTPLWRTGATQAARRKAIEIKGAYITNTEAAIKSLNTSEALRLIDEAQDNYVITSEKAAKDRLEVPRSIDMESAKQAAEADPEEFLATIEDKQKFESLMPDDRRYLKTFARNLISNRDILNQKQWEELEGQTNREYQNMMEEKNFIGLIKAAEDFDSGLPGKYASLETKFKQDWIKRAKNELEIQAKGTEILTDSKLRSELLAQVPGIVTGATTAEEIMNRAREARYPTEGYPTLNEKDFNEIQDQVQMKYLSAYGHEMTRVREYARGLLLNPDSLGFIKNAPIRHEIYGNFMANFNAEIAAKGDKLKIGEIYEIGRTLAAMHQVSDEEAEKLEVKMNERLELREAKKRIYETAGEVISEAKKKKTKKLTVQIARRYLDITGGDREEAKRLAAEDGYIE